MKGKIPKRSDGSFSDSSNSFVRQVRSLSMFVLTIFILKNRPSQIKLPLHY